MLTSQKNTNAVELEWACCGAGIMLCSYKVMEAAELVDTGTPRPVDVSEIQSVL